MIASSAYKIGGIIHYEIKEILMTECKEHNKIQLLFAELDSYTGRYDCTLYTFCNNCAVKLADPKYYRRERKIPDLKSELITKTICNIKSNGYVYRLFGHLEDRTNLEKNGEKWK